MGDGNRYNVAPLAAPGSGWPLASRPPQPWYPQPPVVPVPPVAPVVPNQQQPLFPIQGGRPPLSNSATTPILHPSYTVGAPGLPSVPLSMPLVSQPLFPITTSSANISTPVVPNPMTSINTAALPVPSTDLKDKSEDAANANSLVAGNYLSPSFLLLMHYSNSSFLN